MPESVNMRYGYVKASSGNSQDYIELFNGCLEERMSSHP
jgi:hypothetical protein